MKSVENARRRREWVNNIKQFFREHPLGSQIRSKAARIAFAQGWQRNFAKKFACNFRKIVSERAENRVNRTRSDLAQLLELASIARIIFEVSSDRWTQCVPLRGGFCGKFASKSHEI